VAKKTDSEEFLWKGSTLRLICGAGRQIFGKPFSPWTLYIKDIKSPKYLGGNRNLKIRFNSDFFFKSTTV
jgi:hypothetical protein